MSSFKRRTVSKQVVLPSGTRTCPTSTTTVLTSSGISSLDDILGGGVPLSCTIAVLASDSHSAYGELVQKYFVAQGIGSGHKVCIVHENAMSFVNECMWKPNSSSAICMVDEEDVNQSRDKIKIAWRYEQMKKCEMTNLSTDNFCDMFDLTCPMPMSVIDEAFNVGRLIPLDLTSNSDLASPVDECMKQIQYLLTSTPPSDVVRLCITSLGSPEWGELCTQDILRFLHALRRLLRRYPHACAFVSLAPHFCTDLLAGSGWVQKIGWVTDATISMTGFGANPALVALFPSHHGLVQIHKLPTPHSILPMSDKCSMLRGLSSSAAANIGAGENNLAFKCTRRRLIFETMHLDLEGGVTERRTTPSSTVSGLDVGQVHTRVSDTGNNAALACVTVEFEEVSETIKDDSLEGRESAQSTDGAVLQKAKKTRKKVAFHSDKPDLYDF